MTQHSSELIGHAISLRSGGSSFRQISKQLGVPLGTIHLWTRHVVLSDSQKSAIKISHMEKFVKARIEKAHRDKVDRLQNEKQLFDFSSAQMDLNLSDPEFLLGLGLYWAEGFKKDHSLGFANSDPSMINFFIYWLQKYGKVDKSKLRIRIQINKVYKKDISRIEEFWVNKLAIPRPQFQTTSYVSSKKSHIKLDKNYFGLVRVRAIETRKQFVQILGWISGTKALLEERWYNFDLRQGSSAGRAPHS